MPQLDLPATLVAQALLPGILHVFPVPLRRNLPQPPPPSDHAEQACIPHKSDRRNRDVRVLISRSLKPGSDGIVDGKAESVTDEDACDDHSAGQLTVRRDGVVERRRDAQRIAVGEQELAEHEPEPVDVVNHPDAVEDKGERDKDHRRYEEVQGMLRLRDAIVASRETHCQHAAHFA